MSNPIEIGGVKITPEFFESYVKLTILSGEPFYEDLKKEISFQFNIPVLFEHYYGNIHTSRTWYFNGVNHCPFGEPSHEEQGKSSRIVRYYNESGLMENKIGPAKIYKSSSFYSEQWYEDGMWKRVGGPAYIRIDYPTPPCSLAQHEEDGLLHNMTWEELLKVFDSGHEERFFVGKSGRSDGKDWFPPKLNNRLYYPMDFEFSVSKKKEFTWCEELGGVYRKDGSPDSIQEFISAETTYNVGITIFRKVFTRMLVHDWHDYNRNGVLHRTTAPSAICLYNVTRIYSGSKLVDIKAEDWDWKWQLNGKVIPKLKIINWAKKYSVPLKKGPLCGNESIFYKPEDEVCFMADFG